MDLSKAKYILPNLFTLSSAFSAFYAMVITARAESARELLSAAGLIALSMILDGCDGRVARATKTQSEFGVQLDSLADAIAFGVAPAFLVYRWGLESMGIAGMIIAFLFAACGIMRLARFNVLAATHQGSSEFFTGLPIPLAAGSLLSVIAAHLSMTGNFQTSNPWIIVLTVMLGGLMVSNVRYRTFKKTRFRGKAGLLLISVLTSVVLVSIYFNIGLAFAGVFAAYITYGITESTIQFGRSKRH